MFKSISISSMDIIKLINKHKQMLETDINDHINIFSYYIDEKGKLDGDYNMKDLYVMDPKMKIYDEFDDEYINIENKDEIVHLN